MLAFISLRVLQEGELLRNVPLYTGAWTSVLIPPLQKCTPTLILQNDSSSLSFSKYALLVFKLQVSSFIQHHFQEFLLVFAILFL